MNLNREDKKVLQALGRTELGRSLASILIRLKEEMSSTKGITSDYAAQVEGRNRFGEFVDILVKSIGADPKPRNPIGIDDFE